MHHAQAVEMTALIESRTENKEFRLLGARISQSQSDEMNFMKRWLEVRGENDFDADAMKCRIWICRVWICRVINSMLMPGMLTPEQMDALKKAKGAEFDQLVFERNDSASQRRVG